MLILSRKAHEELVISLQDIDWSKIPVEDQKIIIQVCDIQGSRVRVGVQAPEDIPCHRAELLNQRQLSP